MPVVKVIPFDDLNQISIRCEDIDLMVHCNSVSIHDDKNYEKHVVNAYYRDDSKDVFEKVCSLSVIPTDLHVYFYHDCEGNEKKSVLIRDHRGGNYE